MFSPHSFHVIILGIILFLLPFSLAGQHDQGVRTLQWSPVIKMQKENKSRDILHFKNASYELNTLLPIFYEKLKIDNIYEYEIDIYNQVFQAIDISLIRNVDNLDSIPSTVYTESQVATFRKEKYLQVNIIPLRKNLQTGQVEMLTSFGIRLIPRPAPLKSMQVSARQYASQSVLASGDWIRVKVEEEGIYHLTWEQLSDLGISNPANVRIFGNGGGVLPVMNNASRHDDLVENAVYFEKGSDGVFNSGDYIIFYGQGPDIWTYDESKQFFNRTIHDYASYSYYYLTDDLGAGKQIQVASSPPGQANFTVSQYDDIRHHELDDINLLGSGQEWYGEHFDIVTEQTFNLDGPDILLSEEVKVRINAVARASSSISSTTSFQVSASGANIGILSISGTSLGSETLPYANPDDETFFFTPTADVKSITMRYNKNAASAQAWLNFITMNARTSLSLKSSSLIFRDHRSFGAGNISEFQITDAQNAMVWDITHPTNARIMNTTLEGSTLKFTTNTDSLKEFIVFTGRGNTPIIEGNDVGAVSNQNLHGIQSRNYVIISHPDFISPARSLAAHRHDHDGLDTLVVTPEQKKIPGKGN